MTLDHRLIDMLVCPVCKGPLEAGRDADNRLVELECPADKLAFPVHDGIPVMLEGEARPLATPATPAAPAPATPPAA
ncbi:MAG: Trm112 family protein [Burkholderiaceae bacterium]